MIEPIVENYFSRWNLKFQRRLASSATSEIYRVESGGELAILKILTPLGKEDEGDGAKALAIFEGHGAVRLLQSDEWAQLLEYAL